MTDASQCRAIAENGLGVAVIRQHLVYTGCTSPATTNAVTIRILIMELCRSPERLKSSLPSSSPSSSTSPPSHVMVVVLVVADIVREWLIRVSELGELTTASQRRGITENGLEVTLIC